MRELTPPEPEPPEPPRRDRRIVWIAIASAMLHAAVLGFVLWQPLPNPAEAAPPPAIDVELVRPPEAAGASGPPVDEPKPVASAAMSSPTETTSAERPPPEQAAGPASSAAEASAPEMPSRTAAPETASETASAVSEPVPEPGVESSAKAAPIPLSRPRVRGLTAPASVPDEARSAVTTDTGETAEGAAPPAPSAEPDVATLELGTLHKAKRFYLKAMLSAPSMARARAMLETLPPEKRLAQTCNIEALAQIGNAGEGLEPDVVMAEAYSRSEVTGTHVTASGAIFRSGDRWYGLAFDCTLSDDLSDVIAFSYRLGADVTDAVLARLSKT